MSLLFPPQAQDVEQVKTSYSHHVLTDRHAETLSQLAEEGDVYGRLSRSIAPEIFGMEDVKKVREGRQAGRGGGGSDGPPVLDA